jgi:hypothetical protein
MFPPDRVVCLGEETTETLYLLGAKTTASSASRAIPFGHHEQSLEPARRIHRNRKSD